MTFLMSFFYCIYFILPTSQKSTFAIMIKIPYYCLFFCLLCNFAPLLAQTTTPSPLSLPQTRQLWLGSSVKFELSKKINFVLDVQERSDDNWQYLIDRLFIEPSLRYSLSDNIEFRAGYRYGFRAGNKAQNRFWGTISYSPNLGDNWNVKIGSILQTDYIDAATALNNNWRPQLSISYQVRKKSKLIPEIGGEFFYTFNNKYHTITRYRLYGGLKYELNKQQKLSLKYIYQRSINVGTPELDQILSISYDISVNKSKKKKKVDNINIPNQ